MKEETGIEVETIADHLPFLKLERFNDNHYGTGKKCLSEIFYYVIYTNQGYDLYNINLDEKERTKDFKLKYIDLDDFNDTLRRDMNYISHSVLYEEMIEIIDLYKSEYCNGHSKIYQKEPLV